ncbi:YibE/F family protein [Thermohalobacter berrensis]|uniref:YibE/F family protein n=1 Tax=Thermohalobacter berrensis TaxID=99594 RepID=A0A419T690_9FIRM|nr:YibE/F family protein [Thermohalobacter berrensis]RKD32933.1 hypothetical protein BET03_09965 [Thermohalobacter berrensis]
MNINFGKYLSRFLVLLIIFIIVLTLNSTYVKADVSDTTNSLQQQNISEETPKPVRGKVLEIISDEYENVEGFGEDVKMRRQQVEVKITSGKHKGEIITVEHVIDERFAYNIFIDAGDDVLLYLEEDEKGEILVGYISDIVRDKYLLYLVIGFIGLLIAVGGIKGIKTVLTLGLTIFSVVKILLPLILKGYSPILISVLISVGVITITLLIISGPNKKTLSAIIGTSGGVLIAGLIALGIGNMASLTGLGNEEAQMLMFIPQEIDFNFKGLLFSGIILGALGAVMDVSMSISSAMNEIYITNPQIEIKNLVRSGINIGRDIMGTMSNTLILAYVGGAIHLMLLFMAYDYSFIEIINRDMIASEVVRALAGSIGIILTIPITALVSGTIYRMEK